MVLDLGRMVLSELKEAGGGLSRSGRLPWSMGPQAQGDAGNVGVTLQ